MALLERGPLLGQLSTLLGDARHGRGRLVLVVGEAGIGKTSLVEAFCGLAPSIVRTYWGTCDPLVPPRPFTPVVDIADRVGGDLQRALADGDRDAIHEAFLALLRRPGAPPAIVVLDDLHWADAATLDLFQVIARRVSRLPTLIVGTYRDHEVGPDHPLRMALGDVPAGSVVEMHVPPLSVAAVERLAQGRVDASALHAATAGNAFYVSEVLAAGGSGVPATVRDAVLVRIARLSAVDQGVMRAAAVLGPASRVPEILAVAGAPRSALDECAARGLLRVDDEAVAFRHDLGRQAVLESIPEADRVALNGTALGVLREQGVTDVARLARHAISALDRNAVIELAPAAAAAAARLGAHREAASFYESAIECADGIDPTKRAELLERYAEQCTIAGDTANALAAQQEALRTWRRLGDQRHEGIALTDLSLIVWLDGAPLDAMNAARSGADLLEVVAPGSPELARAWAVLAQRQLVAGWDVALIETAARAIELAEQHGDERTVVHAMTTMSVGHIFLGNEHGWSMLEEAAGRGRAAELPEETARALINLVETARDLRRFQLADRYIREATAFLNDHEVGLYHHLLRTRIAALELEAGRWQSAVDHAAYLLSLGRVAKPIRVRALTIVGLVDARRGTSTAGAPLDEALDLAADDYQDLVPILTARAEAAWLAGDNAQARAESAKGLSLAPRELSPWWWSELAFWGSLAGTTEPLPHPDERPYWLHAIGHHGEAAAAWEEIGAPYMQALALADCDADADLRKALALCNGLGARVLARRIGRKLRERGASGIARGPRTTTQANPRQLTARQMDILTLLAAGLPNADIAARLVLSPKTVDHHVSAVLHKLGVSNRVDAAQVGRDMGLRVGTVQDGEAGAQR
jgi:DNA-binding CsgD family transcriptional regulator/tetratricopeptide (TPR) repeat protein